MRPLRLQPIFVSGLALWFAGAASAEVSVAGKIVDENGLAVAFARVELRSKPSSRPSAAMSDIAGGFSLQTAAPGEYLIHAERPGFFVFDGRAALRDGSNQLHLTLNHLQEFFQSVDVAYSAPTIDPEQPADQKQLTNVEILQAPYAASQDLRNAMPLLQGVVQDVNGRLHFNGGATDQTNFTLDGFNISDPFSGRFEARLNIEAVRSLDLDSARYSAEKDRGSAGAGDIKNGKGDDPWRFRGPNFIPRVSPDGEPHNNTWTAPLK